MRWTLNIKWFKVASLLAVVAGLAGVANLASAEPNKNAGSNSRGVARASDNVSSAGKVSSLNKASSMGVAHASGFGTTNNYASKMYQPKHPGTSPVTQSIKIVDAPKGTGGFKPLGPGGKPIAGADYQVGDRGISDRVGPVQKIPGLGIGKGPIKTVPGLGIGDKGPKIPLDPGIGNGKGPIKKLPDLGIGKKPKFPIDPGFGVGPGKGGPKIPICPPHKHPKYPCPPHFHDWCWAPWFGFGFGYSHGYCIDTVVVRDVIVEVPVVVESLPTLVPGTTIVVAGQHLGLDRGQVLVKVGGIALPAEIVAWEMDKVTLVLPTVALMAPTKAELIVLRADGSLARQMPFEFVAGIVQQ